MLIILIQSTKLESDEEKLLKKWEIKKEKKIILLPGRLTPWKGQELFIEAVNLVQILNLAMKLFMQLY